MQEWVIDMADTWNARGVAFEFCPHPPDDIIDIVWSVYDAARCGWCGAICLLGVRE